MARLVVLRFDDNEVADEFIKNGKDFLDSTYDNFWGNVHVKGLYAMPTQFCDSGGGCSTGKRIQFWTRGTKFGWWVCKVCRKPAKTTEEKTIRAVVSQGTNLLKAEGEPQEVLTVFDKGWGAAGRG